MSFSVPTVYIVDDDESFLTALSRFLRAAGFAVKTYPSATKFLGDLERDAQGCVIADLIMPGVSGLDLQTALSEAEHTMPVVFLTGHGDIPTSVHAMRHGAEDFLTKNASKEKLLAAVRRALRRDAQARDERARLRELRDRFSALTIREREVLAHLLEGQLNKQTAFHLGITERTVKVHRATMMKKLQVQSVAELTRLVQEAALLKNGRLAL